MRFMPQNKNDMHTRARARARARARVCVCVCVCAMRKKLYLESSGKYLLDSGG